MWRFKFRISQISESCMGLQIFTKMQILWIFVIGGDVVHVLFCLVAYF